MKSVPDKQHAIEQMRDKILMVMQDDSIKDTLAEIAKQAVSTERLLKDMLADTDLTETITKIGEVRVWSIMH